MESLSPAMLYQITCTSTQVSVEVNSAQEWVTIRDLYRPTAEVFLQGHEATAFITRADAMYNKYNMTKQDAYYYFAYEYLDVLGDSEC